MRTDIPERREEIEAWIAEQRPKAHICRELQCKPETLDSWLNKMGIIYAGNRGERGWKRPANRRNAKEYLKRNVVVKAHRLKLMLIRDGVKEHRCERCNKTRWEGEPIPIELHHINGDPHDNRLENLQILCPNCHALTPNHAGRGIGRRNVVKQNVTSPVSASPYPML